MADARAAVLVDRHIGFISKHQPREHAGVLWAGPGLSAVRPTESKGGHSSGCPSTAQGSPSATTGDRPDDGDTLVHWVVDSIFVSGLFWGLNTETLLGRSVIDKQWAVERILACRCGDGGFAASPGHDAHVLYTYSAVQALALCGVDLGGIANVGGLVLWLVSLQAADGSFGCDEFGDADSRFTYAAMATLRLLCRVDAVDSATAAAYILRCRTVDGGFGARPGAEAHAGQTFCSVAALALCGHLAAVATDSLLLMWLSERQNADGGVNGRPGKRTDACYAWWVGATAAIVGRPDLIDGLRLQASLLQHQSPKGGIAAHIGDRPDLFHTHFGIAALGVLGHPDVARLDPILCLPTTVIGRCIASSH